MSDYYFAYDVQKLDNNTRCYHLLGDFKKKPMF